MASAMLRSPVRLQLRIDGYRSRNGSGPSQSRFQSVCRASALAGIARGVLLVCGCSSAAAQRRARPMTKAAQKAAVQAWSPANNYPLAARLAHAALDMDGSRR
ncbi:MAG: hypothetical protein MJD61_05510 [Proteobacteria bacterium]|nr:hypothetical protein [Pseudomonadota bacterium]